MAVKVLAFFDTRFQNAGGWDAVTKAYPLSRHYTPLNRPAALGLYDLTRRDDAAAVVGLAAKAGIDGFVVDCIADGERYVTGAHPIAPLTSPAFGLAFQWRAQLDPAWRNAPSPARADALIDALKVGQPVTSDGRLILVVEGMDDLAQPTETAALLRAAADRAGLPGLYLVAVQAEQKDCLTWGFDSALDPGPADWTRVSPEFSPTGFSYIEINAGWRDSGDLLDRRYTYIYFMLDRMKNRRQRGKVLPRVFPGFENWASQPASGATLLAPIPGLSPFQSYHYYGQFLENAVTWTERALPPGERMVFVQSWNGWLDHSQIEPSQMDGDLFYNETRDALERARFQSPDHEAPRHRLSRSETERLAQIVEAAAASAAS